MTVTLFIPIRNEIDGLKAIMPRIKKEWVDEILIIDGNSTDGSQEYLKKHGYDFTIQKSKGVRGAFWEGFELAKGEVIILFSPDNNSVPEDIPLMIEKIKLKTKCFVILIASTYVLDWRIDIYICLSLFSCSDRFLFLLDSLHSLSSCCI